MLSPRKALPAAQLLMDKVLPKDLRLPTGQSLDFPVTLALNCRLQNDCL